MLSLALKPVQKAIEYFKNTEVGGALKEAVKKAKETKDTGFFEKIKIFFAEFIRKIQGVDKDKEKVTKQTTEAISKSVDETMQEARDTLELDKSVGKEDREFFDEVLAMGVSSSKEIGDEGETKLRSGLKKIDKSANGEEEEPLDIEESMSVAAVGIMTLRKLRKRYSKETEFKAALDRIITLSDKSKYPLKTILTERVLGIFRIQNDSEGLKFLSRFGIEATAADLMGNGEASHAKKMLESLSKRPIENIDEVTDFMKKHFFPNTPKGNVRVACETISEMIMKEESRLGTKNLAKLAFLISESDYEHLINALVGRQTALADAA